MINSFLEDQTMAINLTSTANSVLLSKHHQEASKLSEKYSDQDKQWTVYLKILAVIGFEEWLKEKQPNLKINKDDLLLLSEENDLISNLQIEDFKFCLILINSYTEETITFPQELITSSQYASHFYVIIEVLEEENLVMIRGFIRYDQLLKYFENTSSITMENLPEILEKIMNNNQASYQLPIENFNPKLNQLLYNLKFVKPSAIAIPIKFKQTTKLSQWLSQKIETFTDNIEQITETGWQMLEEINNLINSESLQLGFASNIRSSKIIENNLKVNSENLIQRIKLFNYQLKPIPVNNNFQEIENYLALSVSLIQMSPSTIKIIVGMYPTKSKKELPQGLELMLLDNQGESLMNVKARNSESIELDFSADQGDEFNLHLMLNNISYRETFIV